MGNETEKKNRRSPFCKHAFPKLLKSFPRPISQKCHSSPLKINDSRVKPCVHTVQRNVRKLLLRRWIRSSRQKRQYRGRENLEFSPPPDTISHSNKPCFKCNGDTGCGKKTRKVAFSPQIPFDNAHIPISVFPRKNVKNPHPFFVKDSCDSINIISVIII